MASAADAPAEDAPAVVTDDKLRRGLRALQDVGPGPGETLEQWAARIGTGCGWGEERSDPLRVELTRMVDVWVERGYILPNTPPRLTYTHCREVIGAWKHTFGPVTLGSMPDGWLGNVHAFDQMKKAALKSDKAHKEALDQNPLSRLDAKMTYADSYRLAEECIELAGVAQSAAVRCKWVQQWQTLAFALVGPRAQLMLTTQDYSHSQFRAVFGAGDKYNVPLFKHAAYRQQPACVSYHHLSKNDQSRAPLNLIPGRLPTLCPLIATSMLRLLQHGHSFGNLDPPGWHDGQQQAVDWPAFASAVNAPAKAVEQVYTQPLQDAAADLGMHVEGGMLKTLRQLNVMHTSANVDCTDEEGARIAEHNREGRRDKNYYVMHARATQLMCHYPNEDPTQAASLCALTELMTEHDVELTELVLSGLSDSFRAGFDNSDDDIPKSASNFYEITMYLIKVAVVLSRARMYNSELRITEECKTPMQTHELFRKVIEVSFGSHPFFAHIDRRIAYYEAQEIALGDAVLIPTTIRFAHDKLLKANLRGVQELLSKTGPLKMSSKDTQTLYDAWLRGQIEISDEDHADLVARAQPTDETAARHLLAMSTPLSESLRSGARLYQTSRERWGDVPQMSEAKRQALERKKEAVELEIGDLFHLPGAQELVERYVELVEIDDLPGAQTFSLLQRRPGEPPKRTLSPPPQPAVVQPQRARTSSPPPQPSAASATSSSSSQPGEPVANPAMRARVSQPSLELTLTASAPSAASATSSSSSQPGEPVANPAKRARVSQPSLELTLTASAPSAASSSSLQSSPTVPTVPTQSFIDSQFSYLTTKAPVGVIVGRFVHRWLPIEFVGGKAAAGSDVNVLSRQRAFLFKALSLTVADGETTPRPRLLRHVLHNLQISESRKADWAKDMTKDTRSNMMHYVYGVRHLKSNFVFVPSVLEALRAGIGEDGSTCPDPATMPAAPPAPSPPPERQLFVGLDPGCCDSSYGVAIATVLSGSIVRVQYDSFKPRGWKDTTAHSLKLGSTTEKLVSYLRGAEAVFIEGFYFDKATASGANTSFYMRAAGHMAAYQTGVTSLEVNFSSWGQMFPKQGAGKQRTAGPSLLNRFKIAVPACNDAIDAICIVLHELVQVRGLALSATAFELFSAP